MTEFAGVVPTDQPWERVDDSIERAQDHLFKLQRDDGHWCGELEGDSILESEYILTMHFVGRLHEERVKKAANSIRQEQLPGGGWAIYPGGPAEVSSSVKAYFVLKLLGDDPEAEHMRRAREVILGLGGIEACNSFTKIYLAIFDQIDWSMCPAIPPELILLPRWFYINIYEMSSWSRGLFIPLSIIWAKKLRCPVPAHAAIPELKTGRRPTSPNNFWRTLFMGIDQGIKLVEKIPVKPSREYALRLAERWIVERLKDSDGLGAIFPPIVYTIFAWRALGYAMDHPIIRQQQVELEKLEVPDGEIMRIQPCLGPVWDTGIAINALIESGVPAGDERIQQAAHWVMDRRGHGAGDWRVKAGDHVEKPGWYFEYANPYYPDNDTTAKVMTALSKVRFSDDQMELERRRALKEAHQWHLSMQNADGGWGAFDKDCDKEILTQVPFADHNAMIDPSNEDITARILETFDKIGLERNHPAARRAIRYLLSQQEADGSWYGRWGCNYLYGTWLALWGLRCIGEDMNSAWAEKAVQWLNSCQNEDGGWGELPLSYDDAASKGRGPSTPSQTAWAVMGLLAAGREDSDTVRRGIRFLTSRQQDDGSWEETHWTGTGFPGVFYLRYHLYGQYFPLMALGYYQQAASGIQRLSRSA